jgi:hypothetical protein
MENKVLLDKDTPSYAPRARKRNVKMVSSCFRRILSIVLGHNVAVLGLLSHESSFCIDVIDGGSHLFRRNRSNR